MKHLKTFEEFSINPEITEEGFLNNVKNTLTGTIEYTVDPKFKGTVEAIKYITTDPIGKVVLEQLIKLGMTEEEAKATAMYVFDKQGKFGFAKKKSEFNKDTKLFVLKGLGGGTVNPNPGG